MRLGLVIAGLVLLYVVALPFSARGWGYPGYYGYHRGASFWYWGGVPTYHGQSVRGGSVGGPSFRGGGPRGGK